MTEQQIKQAAIDTPTTDELIAMANDAIVAKDKAKIAAVSLEMRRRDGAGALVAGMYSGFCEPCGVEFWIGEAASCPVCGVELLPF